MSGHLAVPTSRGQVIVGVWALSCTNVWRAGHSRCLKTWLYYLEGKVSGHLAVPTSRGQVIVGV